MKTATQLADAMEHDLVSNILPYWMNKMVDHTHGGFYGRRDGHDVLHPAADKGVILHARILWTFAHAVRRLPSHTGYDQYRATADRAFRYLCEKFIDREYGGVYWMLDYTGKPVNTKKQIYAQAFAIYALTEYYLATRHEGALQEALMLYEWVERFSFDHVYNGYLEAFDRQGHLLDDLRLSDKDANEKKTMNTHLHVLEAYTNLYRCVQQENIRQQLRNLIRLFLETILNREHHCQLFFDEQWNVRSGAVSFGHDIEGSWLLEEAARVLGDQALLTKTRRRAAAMVNTVLREGFDADGGIINERHGDGNLDRDKHWWPQAEAIVGLINVWQHTRQPELLHKAWQVWQLIEARFIDRQNGEWFWCVNAHGHVNDQEDKAGPWKCPYHNGRAALEVIYRVRNDASFCSPLPIL